MVSAAEVARFKTANAGIVALMRRDLVAFWGRLNLNRPEAVRDALLEFLPTLTDTYGDMAATIAADWYDDLREAVNLPGRAFRAAPADLVPEHVVQARARFGAQHLWSPDPSQTLTFLNSAMTSYVMQPGHATIVQASVQDPRASGWARVVRPDGCPFCRLLAQRGAVYKESTADFASHDDCNCASVPSWDPDAPEVDVKAYTASRRTTAMTDEQIEAHRANVRMYTAEFADD